MKKKFGNLFAGILRILPALLLILLQLIVLFCCIRWISQQVYTVYLILKIIAFAFLFILLYNKKGNSSTLRWALFIALFPVFGLLLYLFWGQSSTSRSIHKNMLRAVEKGNDYLEDSSLNFSELEKQYPQKLRLARLTVSKSFPLYKGAKLHYMTPGEVVFECLLQDLKSAKKFIFIEFYKIAQGQIWDSIHDILKQKAAQGVEVRVLLDALGSFNGLPLGFAKKMNSEGIQTAVFNPLCRHIFRLNITYRNHRKIVIIDGNTGYIGGCNLADEYANIYTVHGHWKDSGLRLEGQCVKSLTVSFLNDWSACGTKTDYEKYMPTTNTSEDGYSIPFTESPADNPGNISETLYKQIIETADKYVYITSPYLIVEFDMIDALCTAARCGIDVKIITPYKPDHWYTHALANLAYGQLLKAGAKVYEYLPGFIHSKTVLCDDNTAVLGSINMDFRSFNTHFENGVLLIGCPVIGKIKEDIIKTLNVCRQINLQAWKKRKWYLKLAQVFLKPFAPFM